MTVCVSVEEHFASVESHILSDIHNYHMGDFQVKPHPQIVFIYDLLNFFISGKCPCQLFDISGKLLGEVLNMWGKCLCQSFDIYGKSPCQVVDM